MIDLDLETKSFAELKKLIRPPVSPKNPQEEVVSIVLRRFDETVGLFWC